MRSPSDRSSASRPSKIRAWTHARSIEHVRIGAAPAPSSGTSRPRSARLARAQLVDIRGSGRPDPRRRAQADGGVPRRSARTAALRHCRARRSRPPGPAAPPSRARPRPRRRGASCPCRHRRRRGRPLCRRPVPRTTASRSVSSSRRRPMNSGLATRVAMASIVREAAAVDRRPATGEAVDQAAVTAVPASRRRISEIRAAGSLGLGRRRIGRGERGLKSSIRLGPADRVLVLAEAIFEVGEHLGGSFRVVRCYYDHVRSRGSSCHRVSAQSCTLANLYFALAITIAL